MGEKRTNKPSHPGYQSAIEFKCDNCGTICWETKSHYEKKRRHYCSHSCYSLHRRTWKPQEQHAYKGVRKNGESKQVYHQNYCKNHPDRISHLKSRRYAREKSATGNHSLEEWQDLKLKFNNRCAICGELKKLTKDHIIPLSKGGSDYIRNIQPLCRNCNSKKHNHIYEHPELLKPLV